MEYNPICIISFFQRVIFHNDHPVPFIDNLIGPGMGLC